MNIPKDLIALSHEELRQIINNLLGEVEDLKKKNETLKAELARAKKSRAGLR